MSPTFIQNLVIQVLAMALALFLGICIANGEYFKLLGTFGAFFTLLCLFIPELPTFAVVLLQASGLTSPGLPFKLNFFLLFSGAVILNAVVRVVFKRSPWTRFPATYLWIAAFALVVGATMAVRGTGLRAFGSETWGGFVYIRLLLSIGVAWALPFVALSPKTWRNALVGMGLLALLPGICDAVTLLTGNLAAWQFVEGTMQIGMSYAAQETGNGVIRIFAAGSAGFFLWFVFLLVGGTEKMLTLRRFPFLVFPPVFFALILVSGFRFYLLSSFVLLVILMLIQGSLTFSNCLKMGGAALLGLVLVVAFASKLPLSAQRSLSFLPGIRLEQAARQDAEGTITWRLELWRRALGMLPKYWVVGKGFTFSAEEIQMANDPSVRQDELEWAVVSSSFHSGPISLLIGLGVPGFLTGSAFIIGGAVRHRRFLRRSWRSPLLRRCHQAMAAFYFTTLLMFFVFYGDVQTSVIGMLFSLGVLEGLFVSDRVLEKPGEEEAPALTGTPAAG